jgi:hypothetical protein
MLLDEVRLALQPSARDLCALMVNYENSKNQGWVGRSRHKLLRLIEYSYLAFFGGVGDERADLLKGLVEVLNMLDVDPDKQVLDAKVEQQIGFIVARLSVESAGLKSMLTSVQTLDSMDQQRLAMICMVVLSDDLRNAQKIKTLLSDGWFPEPYQYALVEFIDKHKSHPSGIASDLEEWLIGILGSDNVKALYQKVLFAP